MHLPKSKIKNRESRAGFTLVEILIAATLTLVIMGLVVQLFAMVGTASSNTRAILETADAIRNAKLTLQVDLSNITAEMLPPLRPSANRGYFEYIEGPAGSIVPSSTVAVNIDDGSPDTTVGDPDDRLMFTVRSQTLPYQGRVRYYINSAAATTILDGVTKSETAEICYFVRGNVLYRRVLLVAPNVGFKGLIDPATFLSSNYVSTVPISTQPAPSANAATPSYDISYYDRFDVSARQVGGTYDLTAGRGGTMPVLMANTLGDLTYRQNRYGHQPWYYPYDARFWGVLGLPTLRECTFYTNLVSTSAATPPVARWPFPLFDQNPNLLPGVGPGTQNLWGVASPNPNAWPVVIFPSPSGAYAPYQTNNAHVSTVSSPFIPYINISTAAGLPAYDAWENPFPWDQVDGMTRATAGVKTDLQDSGAIYAFSADNQPDAPATFDGSTRMAEDVLLNNVLSFDVKAWDPTAPVLSDTLVNTANSSLPIPVTANVYYPGDVGYTQLLNTWAASSSGNPATFLATVASFTVGLGAYVDLNYTAPTANAYPALAPALAQLSTFSGPGEQLGNSAIGSIYDTGCYAYEDDGIDQDGKYGPDQYTNGFDDNGIGGVDDITEIEGPTPYPVPLKGIQVKIRVFEPDSRQIREITVTEDFLWE